MNLWACWSRVTSQRRSQAFTYYLCRTKVSWKCRIIKMSTCMMVCIRSWWVITKSSSDHVNWSCDEPDMNNPISKRVLSRPAKCNDLESLNIIELVIFLNFVRFMMIFKISGTPVPVMIRNWGKNLKIRIRYDPKNPRNIRSSDLENRSIVRDWPSRFLEWNIFPEISWRFKIGIDF